MILVIADDLSGAAELAGIAFAHGLTAEVQTEFQPRTEAQVICLDTDTRRLSADAAAAVMRKLAKRIRAARPEFIFKKTDSALRGHIAAELGVLLEATARVRAVFVPANPSRGRVIRGGDYFIGDTPLHKTDFAHDPQHPATTAKVAERLGHDPAIDVPEAASAADVQAAAAACDDLVLPAGHVLYVMARERKTPAAHARPRDDDEDPEEGDDDAESEPETGATAYKTPSSTDEVDRLLELLVFGSAAELVDLGVGEGVEKLLKRFSVVIEWPQLFKAWGAEGAVLSRGLVPPVSGFLSL